MHTYTNVQQVTVQIHKHNTMVTTINAVRYWTKRQKTYNEDASSPQLQRVITPLHAGGHAHKDVYSSVTPRRLATPIR